MVNSISATVEGEWYTLKGVKGLCTNHIVKMGPVVYSGAMKTAANQGHYNTNGKVEGPSAKGNSKWPITAIDDTDHIDMYLWYNKGKQQVT